MLHGSWAYGTQTAKSDEDWRGVFQLPNEAFLGLYPPKTTFEAKPDQVYHELGHWMQLLLKGNPNIVSMLWAPEDVVIEEGPVWGLVTDVASSFISRAMASAYRGWIHKELRFLGKQEAPPPKRLSHLPRLAYELHDAVMYGFIGVRQFGRRREFIMEVKEGFAGYQAVRFEVEGVLEAIGERRIERLPEPPKALAEVLLQSFRRTYG